MFIILSSIVSVVCDATGEDSSDSQIKIRRLVNEKGPGFCKIANWPFLRTDISFSITGSAYTYSGASYIPESFQRIVGANLKDSNGTMFDIEEVSIKEKYEWDNPDDNQGRPDQFCITRIESGYYEIQFNRLPDGTYTFYADIEQKWTNVTANAGTIIVTDDYFNEFTHYISMARARQQGDVELYSILRSEWWNPNDPKGSLLGQALGGLSAPLRKRGVRPPDEKIYTNDYGDM